MRDAENKDQQGEWESMMAHADPRGSSSLWMVDPVQKEILTLDISP